MKPHLHTIHGVWHVRMPSGVSYPYGWQLSRVAPWAWANVVHIDRMNRTLVVAQNGLPHVDIITCDSVQEARELVNLACAETVGGCQ